MTPLATITVMEYCSPADEYVTENGQGHADDVEPYEVERWSIGDDTLLAGADLDDTIQSHLDELGIGQWDGGNVAYDPDGSRDHAARGTVTTRYAVIEYAP